MDRVMAKARDLGATDEAIKRWLDRIDPAFGKTPRQLVAEGREGDVIEALDRSTAGVFS